MTNQAAQTMPEPDAYCAPYEPNNAVAFAWPGTDRAPMHIAPLYCQQKVVDAYQQGYAAALAQTAGVPDGWMRDVADAAASLDKRGDRQMAARLMRLHRDMLAAAPAASGGGYPECSGDPASCPENEGHGCCKPNPVCSCPSGDGSLRHPCPVHPQRLAQGECRHSLWSPAGGYCLDCGYSPVGPDEESAIDAAVGLTKVVLRLPVDLLGEIDHRAQQSGCVRNAYLRQLLAEHHSQPPHQDRGEVEQRLRDAIEGECDGLGITEESADAILRYIGFHPDGRIVGGREIDGVWVIEATGHSGLMPNQLLVRYDDYLRDVNSKYRCDDCGGDGRQCLAGRSAHRSNWYACETCNGAGTIAALTEAKQQDNRALAESVFNIPVPARGFHEGWRDEEIWQWALRAAAAHILGTTQSEAEKLLTTSSTGEPEAKQQGPGEAVAYRVVGADGTPCPAFGKWVDVGFWHSSPAIRPVLREGFRYEYAYAGSPQVEAKRQTGEELSGRVCGYTPGQSIVEVKVNVGALPDWLELGETVRIAAATKGENHG